MVKLIPSLFSSQSLDCYLVIPILASIFSPTHNHPPPILPYGQLEATLKSPLLQKTSPDYGVPQDFFLSPVTHNSSPPQILLSSGCGFTCVNLRQGPAWTSPLGMDDKGVPFSIAAPQPGPSGWAPVVLTAVYFLQREVLFQVPPELHLISILAHSPIVRQDKVGMHAVECGELAEGVTQGLVQAHHLEDSEDKRGSELKVLPSLGSPAP